MSKVALITKSATEARRRTQKKELSDPYFPSFLTSLIGFFCVSVPLWQTIQGCKARNLATENPFSTHVPANHRAARCGASRGDCRKSHQTDRKFRVRANSRCAK